MKNKRNFRWIEEVIQVTEFSVKIGDNINKVNLPGKASCSLCHSVIYYGGRGKSAFKEHLLSDMHYTKLKTLKSSYSLGSFAPQKDKLFPLFAQCKKKTNQLLITMIHQRLPTFPPLHLHLAAHRSYQVIPISDRVITMEAMILSVMAENSMPLTFASPGGHRQKPVPRTLKP